MTALRQQEFARSVFDIDLEGKSEAEVKEQYAQVSRALAAHRTDLAFGDSIARNPDEAPPDRWIYSERLPDIERKRATVWGVSNSLNAAIANPNSRPCAPDLKHLPTYHRSPRTSQKRIFDE